MSNKNNLLYFLRDAISKHPDLKEVVADLKPKVDITREIESLINYANRLARGKFGEQKMTNRVASIFPILLSPNVSFPSEYTIKSLEINLDQEIAFFPSESLSANPEEVKY